MEDQEQLIKIIDFWRKVAEEGGLINRFMVNSVNLKSSLIIDIAGPRRSGKSSALKLIIKKLDAKSVWMYINFEDPFFIENCQAKIIEDLIEVFREYFNPKLTHLFFDEIQNINKWEKAVNKLQESGKYKIFITGSSSKLLSGELASLITGRHISYEIMPLNFEEYLLFNGVEVKGGKDAVLKKVKISRNFEKYLKIGGFPRVVLEKNEELLRQYYADILEKDIIKRHEIRHKDTLEKMGVYLFSNSSKLLSIASLEKTFSLSFEVASTYFDYFKQAFLIFELPRFSYSLKTQQKALKKIYSSDIGLANSVSFRFSRDRGQVLENCVFLRLRQKGGRLYYYKTRNDYEVDFLVARNGQKKELIQVCAGFENIKTKQREIRALLEAMDETRLKQGIIITEKEKDRIKVNNKVIEILPVHEWMLSEI